MTPRQKIFAIIVSLTILFVIVDLVKKRRLREEFSWLWILIGLIIFILSVWYQLLEYITKIIGAVLPVSTLFFFGITFLILISLHFSVKVSELTTKVKDLAQRIAIIDNYVYELKEEKKQDNKELK